MSSRYIVWRSWCAQPPPTIHTHLLRVRHVNQNIKVYHAKIGSLAIRTVDALRFTILLGVLLPTIYVGTLLA